MGYKQKLYIETSVISYLTARPSRDLIAMARQEITREWWEQCRDQFDLFVSAIVWAEASKGDHDAVQERLALIEELPTLSGKADVEALATEYVACGIVPKSSPGDAAHLAFASFYGIDLLATWNFKHLANVVVRRQLREFNHREGLCVPIICTPEELLGE